MEGRSVTSVAAEFEILTASFHDFGDNFKLQEQLSEVSVVVVTRNHTLEMTSSTLSYRPEEEQAGRAAEEIPRHRRLDDRYRVYRGQKTARWWSVCTTPCTVCTLTPAIGEGVLSVIWEHPELEKRMNRDEYLWR
ncbi:hypothetical protein TNCV_482001 [Trichonephila clavipes]|nr:hypothetical protein TNCV_482001 [Trichonephila clavipes]